MLWRRHDLYSIRLYNSFFMKRIPTDVFGEWAESGRDVKMAKGHEPAVNHMLDLAIGDQKQFSFIDAGCGNGWVVRQAAKYPECVNAFGVDGAKQMVDKARRLDAANSYVCADLSQWKPNSAVDVVHSMEVIYYLDDPAAFLHNIYSSWLKPGGLLIVGLDFYEENKVSHSWPHDCDISIMRLMSEKTWVKMFKQAGFKNVTSLRFGAKKDWAGTLILKGIK